MGDSPYENSEYAPCVRISAAFKSSLIGAVNRDPIQEMPPNPIEQDRKPRWSTGVIGLDRHTRGGFTGFSGIVGGTGVGKSDLAFRAATLATLDGFTVFYINGELDRDDLQTRFARVVRGDGMDKHEAIAVAENMVIHHVDRDTTLGTVVEFMEKDVIQREAEKVIVVWDTVDTIASWQGRDTYFDTLEGIYLWSMSVRMTIPSLVSVLTIAEANKDGGAKGRRLEKWADLVVNMRPGREPGTVSFKVPKGRYAGRMGQIDFVHDWQRCQFRLHEGI